jgi:hypothetical protein
MRVSKAKTEPEILRALLDLRAAKVELEQVEEQLWCRFFAIADKKAGAEQGYRYVDPELAMVLARTYAESAKVNGEELRSKLSPAQWNKVSMVVRVLDDEALSVAMRRGEVSELVVEECTLRKRTARRLLHHATKDEQKALAAA